MCNSCPLKSTKHATPNSARCFIAVSRVPTCWIWQLPSRRSSISSLNRHGYRMYRHGTTNLFTTFVTAPIPIDSICFRCLQLQYLPCFESFWTPCAIYRIKGEVFDHFRFCVSLFSLCGDIFPCGRVSMHSFNHGVDFACDCFTKAANFWGFSCIWAGVFTWQQHRLGRWHRHFCFQHGWREFVKPPRNISGRPPVSLASCSDLVVAGARRRKLIRCVLKVGVLICRKSTFFERDHLPAVAQSVQFLARRQPEMNHRTALRSAARRFVSAVDILFFTVQCIGELCRITNKHAWTHIFQKPTYSGKDSSWRCHSSSWCSYTKRSPELTAPAKKKEL